MGSQGFPNTCGLLRELGGALAAVLLLTGSAGGAEHASELFRPGPPWARHGHAVSRLPAGHRTVWVGGVRYFYYGGVFYRPAPTGFVVVAAPIGAVVVSVPPGYTSVWIGGVQYFLYNDVYYRKVPTGYVVVAPPAGPGHAPTRPQCARHPVGVDRVEGLRDLPAFECPAGAGTGTARHRPDPPWRHPAGAGQRARLALRSVAQRRAGVGHGEVHGAPRSARRWVIPAGALPPPSRCP